MKSGPTGHDYRDGVRGRSIRTVPGPSGVQITAHIQCGQCPTRGTLKFRKIASVQAIDRKFIQIGWAIPPRLCPGCAAKVSKPKEKPMTGVQSVAAMKATIAMNDLLAAHFDSKNGRYVAGWSDEKIAKEAGLGLKSVAEYRIAAFGEIREPTELALIRADITALEQLQREHEASMAQEIASLRGKLGEATRKLGLAA